MKLEQSFEVARPDRRGLGGADRPRAGRAVPARRRRSPATTRTAPTTATFTVKLGPTTAAYNGTIRIESADEAAHGDARRARTDKRGQGGAGATIVNTLTERRRHDARRRRHRLHDHRPARRLSAAAVIKDISNRLLRDFATCLPAAKLAGRGSTSRRVPGAPR